MSRSRTLPHVILYILSIIFLTPSPVHASFYFQPFTNSSCSIPSSSLPTISLPALGFTLNNATCIPGEGVSGRPGVQWLAYRCPSSNTSSAFVYEYQYSINGSCPYLNGAASQLAANWSLFAGSGNPLCRSVVYSSYNTAASAATTDFTTASLLCNSVVVEPNSASAALQSLTLASAIAMALCVLLMQGR